MDCKIEKSLQQQQQQKIWCDFHRISKWAWP